MKNIFLTLTLLSVASTISFAQTTQEGKAVENYESEQLQIERLSNTTESTGKKKIELEELPLQVQDAFQNSEYQEWEVAEIYEIQEPSDVRLDDDDPRVDEPQYEYNYEILLINEDLKEEMEKAQESLMEKQEEDRTLNTETVETEVPSLVLHYDQTGELLDEQQSQFEDHEGNDNY